MPTSKLSHHLASALLLCAALFAWSTAALASVDSSARAVAYVMDALTTVVDQSLLEHRFHREGGAVAIDLKIDGEWIATDGEILDLIAASSSISAVTSRFQPEPGTEQRMRFKIHDSPTWGPWSDWTTGRIAHVSAVPGAGQMNVDAFEVETRPVNGTPTIATHGYVKIKKLNSGG